NFQQVIDFLTSGNLHYTLFLGFYASSASRCFRYWTGTWDHPPRRDLNARVGLSLFDLPWQNIFSCMHCGDEYMKPDIRQQTQQTDQQNKSSGQARHAQAAGAGLSGQPDDERPTRRGSKLLRSVGAGSACDLFGLRRYPGTWGPHQSDPSFRRVKWVGPETLIATLTSTKLAKSGGSITSSDTSSDSSENGERKKRKRAARSSTDDPEYWIDESDPFLLKSGLGLHANGANEIPSDHEKQINFTVRGNPRVLVRHRTARGFMYNPSKAAQLNFHDEDDSNDPKPQVLFEENEPLEMSITFRTKRPKSHFVNNKPGHGRLKPQSPGKFHITRSDVDNLAKFVMDSLNGLLYVDDKQVISLKVMKVLDCEGLCLGSTDVRINLIRETLA
ncbi:hypothetical protein THAOC_23513, partial [Thalassiosira oceanica]